MQQAPKFKASKLRQLLLSGRRYTFSKGEVIHSSIESKELNLVVKGYVKRYLISNDGRLGVQSIYGPEDIYPLTPVFKNLFDQDIYQGPETYHYEAMVEIKLYTIDLADLARNATQDQLLYRDLLWVAGRRLQSNIQLLENLALRNSLKRVAHQLAFYARQFGEVKASGIKINLPLTHQDIADILGITRETVSTCIAQLRQEKLIRTGKNITVPNIKNLEEAAYS